ncbi:helix-turn-helix transcriptional regulator [Dactylosporangium sp. NPDC006015]|uniref:helix-turn-helix transcriptional regulator n=1 Tax=Dactylosporangium sp. NPDC006015 TaxID=3154576 RepID=UPI0033B3C7FD
MNSTSFGERLRLLREQHGLTQQEFVDKLAALAWTDLKERVGIDRQMVSKWERDVKAPDRRYRRLICTLYGVTEQHLAMSNTAKPPAAKSASSASVDALFESPLDIAERRQRLTMSNTDDHVTAEFDDAIDSIVELYEQQGPEPLVNYVVLQRQQVQRALDGSQRPHHREKLYLIAGKLSGLLGYMAVNLGKFSAASAYSEEAFQLGEFARSTDLQAWARGTQSFCAYYVGDYRTAVDLARDGQRYAKNGPQAIRLASNGEARALGKLGDVRGVDEAVQRAYRLAEQHATPPGVSSCISFGLYSNARTASNAATAYVDLGLPDRVREFADQVMPIFEASESRWSQSLVRLDIAKALILANEPEPDEAARLVVEALTLSAERPILSVLKRSRECIDAASRWSGTAALIEAAETLRAVERR